MVDQVEDGFEWKGAGEVDLDLCFLGDDEGCDFEQFATDGGAGGMASLVFLMFWVRNLLTISIKQQNYQSFYEICGLASNARRIGGSYALAYVMTILILARFPDPQEE